MDKDLLNIKLMVADRLYPLSIVPSEEESFRLAAKKINEMIQTFERRVFTNKYFFFQAEDGIRDQITKKLQDIYAVLNSLA